MNITSVVGTAPPFGITPELEEAGGEFVPGAECEAYGTREGVEIIFGTSNVRKWADLNNENDASFVARRIDWALCLAKQWVNDRLRGGPYDVPFATSAVPESVTDCADRMAGVLLYESRGTVDVDVNDRPVHQLSWHRKYCEQFVKDVHGRKVRLDVEGPETSAPFVVTQE